MEPNSCEHSDQEQRERLELPFGRERFDMAIWCYDHRYGLCVVVIFYLIIAIAFVSARFVIETRRTTREIEIELPTVDELAKQRDELQKSIEQLQQQREIDWESIRNEISNEEMNEEITEEQMREMIESGEAAEQFDPLSDDYRIEDFIADQNRLRSEMQRNQSAYEDGLEQVQRAIDQMKRQSSDEPQQERRDANFEGGVTASYSFTHPVRHAQRFIIPAYKCMGGGEVRIAVLLNRDGKVISAEHLMGGDECMQRYALESALSSRFDVNKSAPNPHRGTITYFYVPQ